MAGEQPSHLRVEVHQRDGFNRVVTEDFTYRQPVATPQYQHPPPPRANMT